MVGISPVLELVFKLKSLIFETKTPELDLYNFLPTYVYHLNDDYFHVFFFDRGF